METAQESILNSYNLFCYLDKIQIAELKKFVEEAINKFGSEEKLKKSNLVADVIWQKFEHLGYINKNAQQQFVDITIAAALLYNLFFEKDKIYTILLHRYELKDLEKEIGIDDRLTDCVYQTIESHLGENHPIQKLKPIANSPASILADAVWQVNNYICRV